MAMESICESNLPKKQNRENIKEWARCLAFFMRFLRAFIDDNISVRNNRIGDVSMAKGDILALD